MISRKTCFAFLTAAVAVGLVLGAARALNAANRPSPPPADPAAPTSHRPDPVPSEYWTKERVENARPAPMPITEE
ncbi:hypothetical protein ACQEU3_37210 [Spirillospora sp. CA-253888]